MIDGCWQLFLWVPSNLFLKWISVLSSVFVCWRYTRSIRYVAVVRLWLMHSVVEIHWSFEVDHVSEVAYWILSTCLCWSSIGATVRGTIFGCCQLFCWWISVLVFSSDSLIVGSRPSCREGVPFVEVLQIFWSGSLPMLSVLRWGLSNGELAVARTIWRVSVVGGVRSLFDYLQLLLRSISF